MPASGRLPTGTGKPAAGPCLVARNSPFSPFKAFVLQNQRDQHKKSLYSNVRIVERSIYSYLKPGEILVKINAAGFNHREVRSV